MQPQTQAAKGKAKGDITHRTALFLVAAELARRHYTVSFNDTPKAPLKVDCQTGQHFLVDVHGLSSKQAWLPGKLKNDFYVLVTIGDDHRDDIYFICNQDAMNSFAREYQRKHPNQKTLGGFNWADPKDYKDKWEILPPARGPSTV